MDLSNKSKSLLLKAVAVFFVCISIFSFFGNNLACYDKGIILSIVASIILGCYGFPVYLKHFSINGGAVLVGQLKTARIMSWYGLFLLIIGFILQLSFWG